jgi:hypothetical protein
VSEAEVTAVTATKSLMTWNAAGIARQTGAVLIVGDPNATRCALDGPAGSGKTRALRGLMFAAADERTWAQVAFMSFARNVVRSTRQTVFDAEGDTERVRTIHSWCANVLHLGPPFSSEGRTGLSGPYLDLDFRAHREAFVREVLDPFESRRARRRDEVAEHDYARLDEFARMRKISIDEAAALSRRTAKALDPVRARDYRRLYAGFRERHELFDYTDLLERVAAEKSVLGAGYVFVDEGQDFGPLEWDVLAALTAAAHVVVVAGDAAQAIYFFKGGSARDFLRYGDARLQLTKSYRVPAKILAPALHVASLDPQLADRRDVRAVNSGGVVAALAAMSDLSWSAGSYLVLARNWRGLMRPEQEIEKLLVPFFGACGGGLPEEGPMRDALLAMRSLAKDEFVSAYDARGLLFATKKGYWKPGARKAVIENRDDVPLEFVESLAAGATLGDAIRRGEPWRVLDVGERRREYMAGVAFYNGVDALTDEPKVRLSTVHGAKGLEADVVVLVQDWSPASHGELVRSPAREHLVAHVAMTRASRALLFLPPRTKRTYPFPRPTAWFPKGGDLAL